MRNTTDKLEKATSYFFQYDFRKAYHLYHQAFSLLPFGASEDHFNYIGFYTRTLLELDRMDELRFYIPILEQQYEKKRSPYIGYTLGYIRHQVEGRYDRRAIELLRQTCENAREDKDLFIKAKMILARTHTDNAKVIEEIHSIQGSATDPILNRLLHVWRCYVLQFQGKSRDSVLALNNLIATLPPTDWYTLLNAKDILIRGYLDLRAFNDAREEINGLGDILGNRGFRTANMHMDQLNECYRSQLAGEAIAVEEGAKTTLLSYNLGSVRINQPAVRKMISIFLQKQRVTKKRILRGLNVEERAFRQTVDRFIDKLSLLSLPQDSLCFDRSQVEFIPQLSLAGGRR